ncbi:hypothetical protein CH63R_04752 [Colletotrichum higginsianum IMI 349063]|uniref:Uncharacterized protein n=1 Tax=Colletotrichum higginsianum (strain IMI 349063) TaxID=759273 RepID=A0A1B7YKA7_COLHI|nr:hypothetical protein CH63R_04752 [Colletotrichum higginsianum IMI 349063]OBR12456.1 hypothetical protein CH63R_04752 [Colletotrichum higginsianum IMI 349063]
MLALPLDAPHPAPSTQLFIPVPVPSMPAFPQLSGCVTHFAALPWPTDDEITSPALSTVQVDRRKEATCREVGQAGHGRLESRDSVPKLPNGEHTALWDTRRGWSDQRACLRFPRPLSRPQVVLPNTPPSLPPRPQPPSLGVWTLAVGPGPFSKSSLPPPYPSP